MMKLTEFYPEKQGRPDSSPFRDLERRGFSLPPTDPTYLRIAFEGDFDGGDIGAPTEPNDYLDAPFDGGLI